jgi:ketosteroid isomerase-like protein
MARQWADRYYWVEGDFHMSAEENKQLVQHIFSELSQGNSMPFVEGLSDGVRWTIIGTTRWSGTYEGKQAVLTQLLAPLSTLIEGQISLAAHRFIAEDDYVVVEARGNNTAKTGKAYDNTYCYVFRIADGKVEEMTEYMDTELVTAALGA